MRLEAALVASCALLAGCAVAQSARHAAPLPLTAAEGSGFTRTSTTAEVEQFVDACVAVSPRLARLSIGTSTKGRDLALVVAAEPPVRSLAQARASGKLVVVVPDYNPDGNDAIDRKNRADQNGPVEGVGQRANGQGFDLNRDFVKAEAPETRGLLAAGTLVVPADQPLARLAFVLLEPTSDDGFGTWGLLSSVTDGAGREIFAARRGVTWIE